MAAESSASPAIGRALDIMSYLAERAQGVSASTLVRDLGLPRSSAYHILTVLAGRGFVAYSPESRAYSLGPAAYRLTSEFTRHEQVERLAREVMRRIASDLGITVHLGILRGANTLYLLKEFPPKESELEPPLVTAIGVLLPAHLTANGRAILAQMDAAQIRALYVRPGDFVSRTGRGPRSQAELLAELDRERKLGYSEEVELIAAGLRSAGVAIFDLHHLPVAAISCTWRSRVRLRDADSVVSRLVAGAAEVSGRLQVPAGGPPTPRSL